MRELPVLDIEPFLENPTSAAAQRFVAELRSVCHNIGFAHIVGHGIDQQLEEQLFAEARRFLSLPIAERQALALENSAAFRGYTTLGDERTRGRAD